MATVNRFSRPTQVAKFDPLSTQEIMAAPLAKQGIEDAQQEEARQYLQQLYSMKAVGADSEKINQQKDALEQEMSFIAKDIQKNGISNKNSNKLRDLKQKYDKALSASGEIGQADAFVGMRDQARKEFFGNAAHQKRGTDYLNRYWDMVAGDVSAFEDDGTFKTEFDAMGLPQVKSVVDAFNEIKQGRERQNINGTTVGYSNDENIKYAKDAVLNRYKTVGTAEYRDMLATYGSYERGIQAVQSELDNIGRAGEISEAGQRIVNNKGTTMSAGDRKKALAQEKQRLENTLVQRDAILQPTGFSFSSYNEVRDQAAAIFRGDYSEDEAVELYNSLMHNVALVEDYAISQMRGGEEIVKEMKEAESALPSSIKSELAKDPLADVTVRKVNGEYIASITGSNTNDYYENLSKNLTGKEAKDAIDYAKKRDKYMSLMDEFLKEDQTHVVIQPQQFISGDEDLQKQWAGIEENLLSTLKVNPASFTILNDTAAESAGDGSAWDTYVKGKSGVVEIDLASVLKSPSTDEKSFKIMGVQAPSGALGRGMLLNLHFTETVKDRDNKDVKRNREVWVELIGKEGGAMTETMSSKLADINNADLQLLAGTLKDSVEYKEVLPYVSHEKNEAYLQSDRIKQYFNTQGNSGKGARMFENFKGDLDIYRSDNGKYRMQIKSENGPSRELTYKDVLSEYLTDRRIKEEFQDNDDFLKLYLEDILLDPNVVLDANTRMPLRAAYPTDSQGEITYREDMNRYYLTRLDALALSNAPIETTNSTDIFKLLK